MKNIPRLGEQENEILRYISQCGHPTVREVAAYFERERSLARTTILTVMERLRKKGFLHRAKVDGIFRYSEKIETATIMKSKVSEFIERTLGGSLTPLINHFAGHEALSPEEIEKLRAIVEGFDRSKEKAK